MRILYIFIILFFSLSEKSIAAEKEHKGEEARELFDKVFNMVFGPEGSSLSYSVNIVGLYKTQGDVVYKDKKINYEEKRFAAWEDGKVAYMVDKEKKKVDIHDFDDDKKDKYLSMFKYDLNNFAYSYKVKGDYYELTAKVKNSKFFGIRSVTALVRKSNLHPVSLSIKLAFLTTTVQISNFRSGNIDESVFTFPKHRFTDYQYIDHRGE
jgi:hypothetical protein